MQRTKHFADKYVGAAKRFGNCGGNFAKGKQSDAEFAVNRLLRMVIIDNIVINTILGRLTLDRAGMHCPSWDDAFVSSLPLIKHHLGGKSSLECRFRSRDPGHADLGIIIIMVRIGAGVRHLCLCLI